MIKLLTLPAALIRGIKVASTLLIGGAIALEFYNQVHPFISPSLPIAISGLILLERIALSVHLLEAIAAAYFAQSRQQNPLKMAIYTFFVGTVGLSEVLATPPAGE